MVKDNLIEILHEIEVVAKLFKLDPFDIYILLEEGLAYWENIQQEQLWILIL